MASTDATAIPIKNQAYRVTFPILDSDGDLVTGAAGLDSEISKDGGTFTDCTNEATEIATSSGVYYLDLSQSEMNADTVAIIVKTTTTDAKTTVLVMYPAESADIPVNVKAISDDTTAADNCESMFDGTGYAGGTTKLSVNAAQIGGTAQTGRDIGASVLLSPGTGTGQISLSSGAVTVGTNNDKTDYALSASANNSVADAILKRDWTSVTGESARSMLNALRILRNKWTIAGTTLSVKKEDDTTEAWNAALTQDDTAMPITASDPT